MMAEANETQVNPIYEVVRGKLHSDYPNYDTFNGVTYRNTFRVTGGPILLRSVGFYGPVDTDAKVKVDMTLEKAPWNKPVKCMDWFCGMKKGSSFRCGEVSTEVEAEQGKIFYAEFPLPPYISNDTWFQLGFTLTSAHELYCMYTGDQIRNLTCETHLGDRNFDFFLGSRQMHSLAFSVGDPKDQKTGQIFFRNDRSYHFENKQVQPTKCAPSGSKSAVV